MSLSICNGQDYHNQQDPNSEKRPSLIRRILSQYYNILHFLRWPLLVASIIVICVCSYFATKLKQPISNDLRILTSGVEYERAHEWKTNLLLDSLLEKSGSEAYVLWGVQPADTGDHNNPKSWSTLELDETFDPSTTEAQIFLRDYCDRFMAQDFARLTSADFVCPINRFDQWLKAQSEAEVQQGIYESFCAGETGLPMATESFHSCLTAWAKNETELSILSRDGIVKIMRFPFMANVQYLSPNAMIQEEWNRIEDWMQQDNSEAPLEVSRGFFSSGHFWYWDSNYQMFTTAVGSAGIAMAAAAVVILISSRSLAMTIFSVISVGYVLESVTSLMVAAGWYFGLLESICFTILIGVSVDFVIHFSHAYTEQPGNRYQRTKYALIHMGPSILAAGFTTLASAIIMFFTVILFFRLFALVLFFTIIQATVGSFVVFLTLTETMGPANPTFLMDTIIQSAYKQNTTRKTRSLTAESIITEDPMESDLDSLPSDDREDEGNSVIASSISDAHQWEEIDM